MVDTVSIEERSKIMRAVKSKGNKSTELAAINIFRENRLIGWRRNFKIIGKPDFVFPKNRIIVFTDGCFWHGHNCRNVMPKNNYNYWKEKINKNRKRDQIVNKVLKEKGWAVFRIWECELKKGRLPNSLLSCYFNK